MPWNSVVPIGTISVAANRPLFQQNFTYIEVTMGDEVLGTNTTTTRDHFWDVSANLDGRHRFFQSVGFTVGGNPADPVIGTGMDGVKYLKSDGLTPSNVTGWFRNVNYIYQYIPVFLTGTSAPINSAYINLVSVPDNTYGEIFMWRITRGALNASSGYFRTAGGVVEAWAYAQSANLSGTGVPLKYGNGAEGAGLNIRVRAEDAPIGNTWDYRIVYRKI